MNNYWKIICLVIFAALLNVVFSGCTYVGYKAGKSIGEHHGGYTLATIEECFHLKRGTPVRITFKSTEILEGQFAGTEILRPDMYGLAFAEYWAKRGNKIILPWPGDTIRVVGPDGSKTETEFWGVDRGRINILPLADTSHRWLKFSDFHLLTFGLDGMITSDSLKTLADRLAVPVMTTLAVDEEYVTSLAALHEIESIEKGRNTTGFKLGGLLGGLAADILIWSLVISSL